MKRSFYMRPSTLVAIIVYTLSGTMLGIVAFNLLHTGGLTKEERVLVAVMRTVADNYVEEVSRADLVDGALRGMMRSLDDYSGYLDERLLEAMETETSGRFGGVGLELGLVDGYVTVIDRPLPSAPAERAGVATGDRIIEVDHESLKGRTLADTVRGIRGEPGTTLHMRVRRPGAPQPLDFELTRATVAFPAATGEIVEPGYGYLRVSRFNEATSDELDAVLDELQAPQPLAGLVLDLRGNPGGMLGAAVAVADAFLDEGTIVTTEGRGEEQSLSRAADVGDRLGGAPLAVLIDGTSASASEVVAGALQDHRRATLFGTKSFGKATVQTVMRVPERRAIKLTTAHYLTPSGRRIQSNGIEPDVVLPAAGDESRDDYKTRLIGAALARLKATEEDSTTASTAQ